jgi:3-phosphoshikimate 1-carboxyvinyltransferase
MEAHVVIENINDDGIEPSGDICVSSQIRKLTGGRFDGNWIPNIIDEIPVLAVLGTQTESGLEIRDASELRHKECDRIDAIVYNLRQFGARVTEYEDGFFVHPSELTSGTIKSYGDHRIAMAFTIAALAGRGTSILDDTECTAVSFPDFFDFVNIEMNEQRYPVPVC